MFRPLLATFAVLIAASAQGAQIAQEGSGVLLDKVVAIVNDGIVTQSELDERVETTLGDIAQRNNVTLQQLPALVARQGESFETFQTNVRKQVLDRLVLEELQLQSAERRSIKPSDEQVNQALAGIAQENGITLAQLPAALEQQGIVYSTFRDNIRKQITLQMLQRREVRVNVSPRELEQYIERLKKQPDQSREYNVSLILLAAPNGATQAQMDELGKRAKEIRDRARTEDFAQLATAYSDLPNALEGGGMGWIAQLNLPTALADVVNTMKAGDVTDPLATPYGFQIYKINEIRNAGRGAIQDQVHVRHILIKPNELEDDATVRQKLAGIRERVLKGEDFAAFASSLSEDSSSAVNGGEMDWSAPDIFVPEFASTVAGLKENEISEPFQTQFGWHIVQLLGRRQFDTTEDSFRDRAYEQLGNTKGAEETELWLRRMRDEAFVDLDP